MIKITDQEFEIFTSYIKKNVGINLTKKRILIEGRMNNYLQNNGYDSFSSYFDVLFRDKSGLELNNVINYLTTNYSYFMREWDHFEFYKTKILPQIKQTEQNHDLRVWSAGCSTGEEPYTLAMITDEFLDRERNVWDRKILATDISEKVLAQAKNGIYENAALEKVPNMWKMNYFDRINSEHWQVKAALRNEVIFRGFNLMENVFPFKKKFHVIFCRNVMIYFDAETKRKLVEKFYEATQVGGYLIVGQSESIDRAHTQYQYVMPAVYRKGGQ